VIPINGSPNGAHTKVQTFGGSDAAKSENVRTVSICDTQPVTTEGVRSLLSSCTDLKLLNTTDSLSHAMELAREEPPDVLILDKAFGIQAIIDWLAPRVFEGAGANGERHENAPHTAIVVWGVSVTESEALRFLQAGARGILRKTAGLPAIIACVRTVAAGRSWMEDCVFRDSTPDRYPRSELTAREQQVLELVEQGCKNKEIAQELGIRPGTVKIHLKHIFEKTGIRGRYGLALNGWRDRGAASIPA
jgi:DNA-binding NarL/FixJ family response regulator